MSKDIFINSYKKKIDKNYYKLKPIFDDNLFILSALNAIKYEVINCLMINQYISSIMSTNHMVERMLKLALIEREIYGLKLSSNNDILYKKLNKAYTSYDKLTLSQSVNKMFDKKLINKDEYHYINNTIRDNIRNAFSHAEMEKINIGKPSKIDSYMGEFSKLKNHNINLDKVDLSTQIPAIQSLIQKDKCSEIAMPYFENVYEIAKNIDTRLDINKEYYK